MRRISIDTLGLTSPRGATFNTAKRKRPWYSSRPRLLTTLLCFGVLYLWINYGGTPILIPKDSFDTLKDESLNDILNSTLGVCFHASYLTISSTLELPNHPIQSCSEHHPKVIRLLCFKCLIHFPKILQLTSSEFEKILVLNLPFRTDRRDAISLAAGLSNIRLEFVDGVTGESIKQSAYPPPEENIKLSSGIRGSWRTHMNALQRYQPSFYPTQTTN
jgi:hypothetical protein